MLGFWFSRYWLILAITIISIVALIFLIREDNAKKKSKEWESPLSAGLRDASVVVYALIALAGTFTSTIFLHQVAGEYDKTYTMVVDIHYSSHKVVRKTLVSENESFRIEYYDSYAKIIGNGVCLRVNAPIEVVSHTYKQNKQTK